MVGDPRERWTPTMAENDGRGGKQERRRLYWKVREERKRALQEKYERLKPHLGEKGRRVWAAHEVLVWGRGGVRAVAAALGMSTKTILEGKKERQRKPRLAEGGEGEGRERRPGGGRKSVLEKHPELLGAIERIVDPARRGDPTAPLKWTSKSLSHIVSELSLQGYSVSTTTVSKVLQEKLDFSLQALRKTREGAQHRDRDAQFRYINQQCQTFPQRGQPVISVDSKKKENVGDFKNGGREWQRPGEPEEVRVYDFP